MNQEFQIEQRRNDVTARFPKLKIDALLVSSLANVRYLSGFDGSNAMMLLLAGETHFFTDPRYAVFAKQNIAGKVHVVRGPLSTAVLKVAKRCKLKNIGFEYYQSIYLQMPLSCYFYR